MIEDTSLKKSSYRQTGLFGLGVFLEFRKYHIAIEFFLLLIQTSMF